MSLKLQILQTIYDKFEQWSAPYPKACKEGCAACCTQKVNITGLEAELILDYIVKNKMQAGLADTLNGTLAPSRPNQTMNEMASQCLEGIEPDPGEMDLAEQCPFLDNDRCIIYPVRPFGCRCFLSQHSCSKTTAALVDDGYFAACTAATQLIEHLGQREYWGNMWDVIPAMLDISAYHSIAVLVENPTLIHKARASTLSGIPLPGFLLTPEESQAVSPLLESIFTEQVDGKTIEDILNGK